MEWGLYRVRKQSQMGLILFEYLEIREEELKSSNGFIPSIDSKYFNPIYILGNIF